VSNDPSPEGPSNLRVILVMFGALAIVAWSFLLLAAAVVAPFAIVIGLAVWMFGK